MTIPDETLTAILEAREAATAGEWIFHDLRKEQEWEGDQSYSISVGLDFIDDARYYRSAPSFHDAAFITLACNNAAELVREVRALRELCLAAGDLYKGGGTFPIKGAMSLRLLKAGGHGAQALKETP